MPERSGQRRESVMRTKQEVLNIVVPHARLIAAEPNRMVCAFQINDELISLYGPQVMPCFIGAMIPQGVALDSPIGRNLYKVSQLIEFNPWVKEYLCEDILFLDDLQAIHDSYDIDSWIVKLKAVSDSNGLNFPEA